MNIIRNYTRICIQAYYTKIKFVYKFIYKYLYYYF